MTRATFSAPIGTRDVLPGESEGFARLVSTFAELAHRYGFGLVISPLFEDVGVFQRGIGADSDVARKEMYVFADRGGRQLALRPEGTASIVRAFVQHHPTVPWKVWYVTPAFRYERPQAGRYRQHHQLGVEALGAEDPTLDVEVIALAWRFYAAVGLRRVALRINSMGHVACREPYVAALSAFLAAHLDELCDEHRETALANPLRVLDCKRPACIGVTERGPKLLDALCEDCVAHFDAVQRGLVAAGIPFTIDPRLVRGFDYYTRTTFEFASEASASAQNAVGGGGRYDSLAAQLGGDEISGIGFGMGIERILLALEAEGATAVASPPVVFIVDTTGGEHGLVLAEELRSAAVAVERAYDARSMKAQMKLADRSGAAWALLIGPQELSAGTVTMRDLRNEAESSRQRSVARDEIVAAVLEARARTE